MSDKQQSLGWLFLVMVVFNLSIAMIGGCSKTKEIPSPNAALQHRWTIVKRTATFSGNPGLNFVESGVPADYLEFRNNDTAYAYFTLYLPFSKDTASYVVSNNTIITTDTRQYGIIFQHQDNTGAVQQTTQINILELTDSSLRLQFPTLGTVVSGGTTTYYPGQMVYDLKR